MCIRDSFDSGPVTYPAYDATTTGLRAIDGIDEARAAFEQFEKDQAAVQVRARLIALENDNS